MAIINFINWFNKMIYQNIVGNRKGFICGWSIYFKTYIEQAL